MSERTREINDAISKLESFKADPAYAKDAYAIDENIAFLKSIKNIFSYIGWLINRPKAIDPARLLELTDFPVEEWDVKMHRRLIEIIESCLHVTDVLSASRSSTISWLILRAKTARSRLLIWAPAAWRSIVK